MQWKPIILLIASTFAGVTNSVSNSMNTVAPVVEQITTIEVANASSESPSKEVIRGNTHLLPELVPVCACESVGDPNGTPTHFEADGVTVKLGRVNPNDVGMCQINTEPRNGHLEASKKMGLDVFTEEGNIKYANHLFKTQGYTPWNWSKHCWNK